MSSRLVAKPRLTAPTMPGTCRMRASFSQSKSDTRKLPGPSCIWSGRAAPKATTTASPRSMTKAALCSPAWVAWTRGASANPRSSIRAASSIRPSAPIAYVAALARAISRAQNGSGVFMRRVS